MPRTFHPLADRVVVKPAPKEEMTKSGIVIPDIAKEKPVEGEFVAVGPGRWEEGKRIPLEVKVGDHVVYAKYAGSEIKEDGQEYVILKEADVLAKIA